jgi:hypothetical protein
MVFSYLKCMHLESVSFAFFHANMQYGFSLLIQLKLKSNWCVKKTHQIILGELKSNLLPPKLIASFS